MDKKLKHRDTFDIYKKLIKKIQNNEDTHKIKHYSDKIKCIVCGKKYTRKNKSIHDKTKYHRINLFENFENFLEHFFLK